MKLKQLFNKAAATLTLGLGLSFAANAALIEQTFEIEYDAGSTLTLHIGADTDNADPFFDTEYLWEDDSISFFNILGLSLPGMASQDFLFSSADIFGAFNYLTASASLNSVPGPATIDNGFFEITGEINLDVLDPSLDGVVEFALFNDAFGTEVSYAGFLVNGNPFGDFGTLTPGDVSVTGVSVSAPATAMMMLLSIGGLVLARRK